MRTLAAQPAHRVNSFLRGCSPCGMKRDSVPQRRREPEPYDPSPSWESSLDRIQKALDQLEQLLAKRPDRTHNGD